MHQLYGLTVLLAMAIALLVVWSRRDVIVRWFGVVLGIAIIGTAYFGYVSLLSLPKPMHLEWYNTQKEARILGVKIAEGKAVYLLLDMPNEPRYFMLPWSKETEKTARDIMRGLEEARRKGVPLMFNFEESLENNPKAYPMPMPKLPDKDVPPAPPPQQWEA